MKAWKGLEAKVSGPFRFWGRGFPHAKAAKVGKGILKFAPRLRDPACAGEFGKRNLESRNHLRDLGVSAVKTYVALTGLGLFLHVSRASPLVEVFRPVGARAS